MLDNGSGSTLKKQRGDMFKKPNETRPDLPTPSHHENAEQSMPLGQNRVKEHRRSVLSPSITIKGDISGTEDLILEGKMQGSITLPKNEVIIGPEGAVKANITASKISIEGKVSGDIKSSERVVIKQSGRLEGNIVAPRVVLEDGCQFKGSVEMNIGTATESQADPKPAEPKPKTEAATSKATQYNSQLKPRASSAS